jgi:hypothetical protein
VCLLSVDLRFVPGGALPAFAGIRYVAAGQSLQQALNEAILGDTIILQAGATFTGNFILPNKTTGTGWITIQSSLIDALPPAGQRVTPTHAPSMAKLRSPNGAAVIATATGAHHYRLIGLDIAAPAGVYTMNLILLGTLTETTPAQLPHSIVLDRLYIHGDARVGGKRGISLNSASTMIMNSWISDIKSTTQDTQAIGGWNGTGPYEIVNNYLEASGENVMFGGATTSIPNVVPSDITLRQNHFSKPLSWKIGDPSYGGTAWMVKNLFELKNARRVVLEGNLFENCWAHAQAGFAIQLTVRTEDGNVPWAVVEDVVFRNNWMRNVAQELTFLERWHIWWCDQTYFHNDNVFETVGGRFLQLLNGANYVTADHNTYLPLGSACKFRWNSKLWVCVPEQISGRGSNGIFGSGKSEGSVSLLLRARQRRHKECYRRRVCIRLSDRELLSKLYLRCAVRQCICGKLSPCFRQSISGVGDRREGPWGRDHNQYSGCNRRHWRNIDLELPPIRYSGVAHGQSGDPWNEVSVRRGRTGYRCPILEKFRERHGGAHRPAVYSYGNAAGASAVHI